MRTRHWLASFMSGCLALAAAGPASAQQPYSGNPDQAGMNMLPAPYNNLYAPMPPQAPANVPGYPPGANAWPNVSPFEMPPVDSTMYEDGFWYNRILQGNREYYLQVEALWGHTQKPETALIGAPGVNPLTLDGIAGRTSGLNTTTTTTNLAGLTQFNQAPPGTGPVRSIGASGGGTAGTTGGSVNIFPSYTTGVMTDTINGSGVRGTWGWFNPDDTGFVVSGFMQSKGTSTFGLDDPYLIIDPNNRNFNALLHLHAWFGLPLAGADTDGTSGSISTTTTTSTVGTIPDGAVQPYDMGVNINFFSRVAGANTDWYFNPVYQNNAIKVRTLAGAKYINLQEAFLFDAYDSGLGYTITNQSTSATGGTNTASQTGGYLTPQTLQALFSTPNVLHSHLTSTTYSNMVGPEIGFRVDLGRKNFTLNLQTRAGAMVNTTQRQIAGFGIGNAFNIITPNTVPTMPNDPSKTTFITNSTTTSLSPMFEQQINFKAPIFSMIPYINRMELFERAQLTGGYTFLFIGDVDRPQNTIVWNQFPKTPTFNNTKSNYINSMVNVGIEWIY